MRRIDCHCHMGQVMVTPTDFLKRLDEAGIEGCEVMSFAPPRQTWACTPDCPVTWQDKLKVLVDFGKAAPDRIYTMYRFEPTDGDIIEQLDRAADAGVDGFKCICEECYPNDEKVMPVWEHIAQLGKPLHFHSGILYSPNAASKYNRPVWFEELIGVPKLKFALAHISWPWVDECLAVYGHWRSMSEQGLVSSEMFLDTTPGTPRIYREEMLAKVFKILNTEDNVMWGVDNGWDYNVDYATWIYKGDDYIFDKLCVSDDAREKYYWKNYKRFIGR